MTNMTLAELLSELTLLRAKGVSGDALVVLEHFRPGCECYLDTVHIEDISDIAIEGGRVVLR